MDRPTSETLKAENLSGTHRGRHVVVLWSESRANYLTENAYNRPVDAEPRALPLTGIVHDKSGITLTLTAPGLGSINLTYAETDPVTLSTGPGVPQDYNDQLITLEEALLALPETEMTTRRKNRQHLNFRGLDVDLGYDDDDYYNPDGNDAIRVTNPGTGETVIFQKAPAPQVLIAILRAWSDLTTRNQLIRNGFQRADPSLAPVWAARLTPPTTD